MKLQIFHSSKFPRHHGPTFLGIMGNGAIFESSSVLLDHGLCLMWHSLALVLITVSFSSRLAIPRRIPFMKRYITTLLAILSSFAQVQYPATGLRSSRLIQSAVSQFK